jgi:hypothetical protein
MQPSWLNNYLGGMQPYGSTPTPDAPNWFQQAIPSQTIVPDGQTSFNLGASPTSNIGMMFASQMLKQGQEKQLPQTPIMKNNLPQGRPMSYEDIMRSYGITGLMG